MSKSDSTWTELGNPVPRAHPGTYSAIEWPDGARTDLPGTSSLEDRFLADVLASRVSRRSFAGPASQEALSALLGATCRPVTTEPSPFGVPLQFRPTPSAGALHPVHILVQQRASESWQRYEPVTHALYEVAGSAEAAECVREVACALVDCKRASVIAFAAEVGRTSVKYANPESLVWRDAGVLLGYLHLCAEALGLAFTPLGITGDPYIRHLDGQDRLRGVGLAVVGLRES